MRYQFILHRERTRYCTGIAGDGVVEAENQKEARKIVREKYPKPANVKQKLKIQSL